VRPGDNRREKGRSGEERRSPSDHGHRIEAGDAVLERGDSRRASAAVRSHAERDAQRRDLRANRNTRVANRPGRSRVSGDSELAPAAGRTA